jgi:hypothetical protein
MESADQSDNARCAFNIAWEFNFNLIKIPMAAA